MDTPTYRLGDDQLDPSLKGDVDPFTYLKGMVNYVPMLKESSTYLGSDDHPLPYLGGDGHPPTTLATCMGQHGHLPTYLLGDSTSTNLLRRGWSPISLLLK